MPHLLGGKAAAHVVVQRCKDSMRIFSKILGYMKLDQNYSLLSCRNVCVLLEYFTALDFKGSMALDGMAINKKKIHFVTVSRVLYNPFIT